jgi:hypothetical protein
MVLMKELLKYIDEKIISCNQIQNVEYNTSSKVASHIDGPSTSTITQSVHDDLRVRLGSNFRYHPLPIHFFCECSLCDIDHIVTAIFVALVLDFVS